MATTLRTTILFSIIAALLQSHFLIVSPCMPCISPWTNFGNHCYLFVTEAKTFDEAEEYCQGLSRHGRPSHLASIMNHEEHDFLVMLIKSTFSEGAKSWIGYRKDRSSGFSTWYFIDDSPSGSYTNWYRDQPSGDGDCAEILETYTSDFNRWNDLSCYYVRSSVCKIPARF